VNGRSWSPGDRAERADQAAVGGEPVPSHLAGIHHLGQADKHRVGEPMTAQIVPNPLDRIELRAVRRQLQQRDIGGYHETLAAVPASARLAGLSRSAAYESSLVKRPLAPPRYPVESPSGRVLIFWMPLYSTNARNCHHISLCAQRTQGAAPATSGSPFGDRSTCRFRSRTTRILRNADRKFKASLLATSRWAGNLRGTTLLKNCCVDPHQSHCRRRV